MGDEASGKEREEESMIEAHTVRDGEDSSRRKQPIAQTCTSK